MWESRFQVDFNDKFKSVLRTWDHKIVTGKS